MSPTWQPLLVVICPECETVLLGIHTTAERTKVGVSVGGEVYAVCDPCGWVGKVAWKDPETGMPRTTAVGYE